MNAKDEILDEIGSKVVRCARLAFYGGIALTLIPSFTPTQYQTFLDALDITYDNGFGGQELYGIIWYTDGTWSERGEYDGSEWWRYKRCPEFNSYDAVKCANG